MNEMSITIDINKTSQSNEEKQSVKEKNEFEKNIISAYLSLQSHKSHNPGQMPMSQVASPYLKATLNSINQSNKALAINSNVLDKLTRISSYGIYYQIQIGQIYLQLFDHRDYLNSLSGPLIITLINQVLNLLDTVKTTSIEYSLGKKTNEFIAKVLTMPQLAPGQKESLKQFMQDKMDNSRHNATYQLDFTSFSSMILSLNTAMEKIASFESQYELFIENMDKLMSLLQSTIYPDDSNETNSYEALLEFGELLLTMLFPETVIVLYQSSDQNEESNLMQFYNTSQKDISFIHRHSFTVSSTKDISFLKEQMIPLALAFIQQFSPKKESFELQYICYMLLRRLYIIFPNYSSKFSSLFLKVSFTLSTFNENQAEECRQLIRNIIDYSGSVQHFLELKKLFFSKMEEIRNDPNYNIQCNDECVQSEPFGIDGLFVLDYDLKIGMFNYLEIPAGEVEQVYIEINYPNSLVDFCVLINELDITVMFSYYQKDSKSQNEFKEIIKFDQVNVFDSLRKYLFFISSPGIMKVSFDNSYSWVNAKSISYKANVLFSSNPFDLLRTISVINFNVFLSKQIDSDSLEKHSSKIIMFKLGKHNKGFNAAKLLDSMTKYNRLLQSKSINQTLPLFIKGNIFWEKGDSKNRKELTKESFEFIMNKYINQSTIDKFTIVNLFNMSDEDKTETDDIREIVPFSLGDLGDQTIVLKSNFVQCCLMLQIYYYILEKKDLNEHLLFIHCGEFGLQISAYHNGVIDYIPELTSSINDLTTFNLQCQLIADYYNSYDYPKKGGMANEAEVIEVLISGITEQSEGLINGLKKVQWKNNIKVSISKKGNEFIEEVIQFSHFFMLPD